MASTNKTTNYNLSQFINNDIPQWLTDYNQDMIKIDAGIKENADAIANKVDESEFTEALNVKVDDDQVATETQLGLVLSSHDYGIKATDDGKLYTTPETFSTYTGLDDKFAISKGTLENVVSGKHLATESYINGKIWSGKNLFDITSFVKGRVDNGNIGYASDTTSLSTTLTSVTFTTTKAFRGIVSGLQKVQPSTEYTISSDTLVGIAYQMVDFYDESNTWISRVATNIFTTPSNCKYIRISYQSASADTFTINNIQLEKGSSATAYEPYARDNYNKPISNVADPTNAQDVATKKYVDDYALKKDTSVTDRIMIYRKLTNGQQDLIKQATSPEAWSIPLRDGGGCVNTGTPTESTHSATKAYVDGYTTFDKTRFTVTSGSIGDNFYAIKQNNGLVTLHFDWMFTSISGGFGTIGALPNELKPKSIVYFEAREPWAKINCSVRLNTNGEIQFITDSTLTNKGVHGSVTYLANI